MKQEREEFLEKITDEKIRLDVKIESLEHTLELLEMQKKTNQNRLRGENSVKKLHIGAAISFAALIVLNAFAGTIWGGISAGSFLGLQVSFAISKAKSAKLTKKTLARLESEIEKNKKVKTFLESERAYISARIDEIQYIEDSQAETVREDALFDSIKRDYEAHAAESGKHDDDGYYYDRDDYGYWG